MATSLVLMERPTYSVRPRRSTSPPSSVPPEVVRRCTGRYPARVDTICSASAAREATPGTASTASSSTTTAVSSTNTASGNASSGGSTTTSKPAARSAAL